MTARRLFAIVWRVNAVVILVAGLLGCAVLAFGAWQIAREMTRTREATGVVNVAQEQIDQSKVQLGAFQAVAGTDVLRASLQREQTYGFGSGSKEASSVQNYLFYDPADGSSHWLLPGYQGLVLSTRELPEREYTREEKPVVAVVYELVEQDTNADGMLTGRDTKAVAVSDPTGSTTTRVLSEVDEVNGTTLTKAGRILVLYTAKATLKAAEIEAGTHKVVRDGPLQTLAPSAR